MDKGILIKEKLRNALLNQSTREKCSQDFTFVFGKVGLNDAKSKELTEEIINEMTKDNSMKETEENVFSIFKSTYVNDRPFLEALKGGFRGRESIIVGQISPFLSGIKGKVLDFGAGSGEIAQSLHDQFNLDIEAVDVTNFKTAHVTIPFLIYDGKNVPVEDNYYEASVMTNVAHHEADNENILKELNRIVKSKLVIIETVPGNESKEEWQRTFVNDTLWNRFFNYADIPVPGTYESASGWIERFSKYGWKLSQSIDLGYDQPTVRDLHHLLVFER